MELASRAMDWILRRRIHWRAFGAFKGQCVDQTGFRDRRHFVGAEPAFKNLITHLFRNNILAA